MSAWYSLAPSLGGALVPLEEAVTFLQGMIFPPDAWQRSLLTACPKLSELWVSTLYEGTKTVAVKNMAIFWSVHI